MIEEGETLFHESLAAFQIFLANEVRVDGPVVCTPGGKTVDSRGPADWRYSGSDNYSVHSAGTSLRYLWGKRESSVSSAEWKCKLPLSGSELWCGYL